MFEDGISRFELNPLSPPAEKAVQSAYDGVDPIVLQQLFILPAVRC